MAFRSEVLNGAYQFAIWWASLAYISILIAHAQILFRSDSLLVGVAVVYVLATSMLPLGAYLVAEWWKGNLAGGQAEHTIWLTKFLLITGPSIQLVAWLSAFGLGRIF